MRRALALLALALVVVVGVCLVRAALLPSRQMEVEPVARIPLDEDALAARLAAGLRFRTISYQEPDRFPTDEFARFQRYHAEAFPRLHAAFARERVGESLLYTWAGSDPSLPPLLLLAHQDVVPVDAGTEERWTQPPWEGVVADGFVWGRGAIDDKGGLFAISEAVELLLAAGFAPERTVLLAFGHDEEVGGAEGAAAIAALLDARGMRPALVLDEGMAVIEGVVPGVERPVALVGVAEKGYATVVLTVETEGGHSSTPPPQSAVGILAAAVHRLERERMPAHFRPPTTQFFAFLAPELPFAYRVPLANLWLFEPVVTELLGGNRGVNATLRTTTAPTMIHGGVKENVLPARATAAVNFRILPGDTSEEVLAHVRRVVDDPRVELAFSRPPREPSPVSPMEGEAFALLHRTIAEVFPGAIVAPGLVLGGTDARNYLRVSDRVYRFNPFVYGPEDLGRPHGTDERVSVAHYANAVRWFVRLIENGSR